MGSFCGFMYLLYRTANVVGWKWPCHSLISLCERVGISAQNIINRLPVLPISSITEVIFVLNAFWTNCNFSWNCFYEWLTLMLDDVLLLTPTCIKQLYQGWTRNAQSSHVWSDYPTVCIIFVQQCTIVFAAEQPQPDAQQQDKSTKMKMDQTAQ